MRFAIAAIMTLFLVGTIFAQDATQSATDATQENQPVAAPTQPAASDTQAAATDALPQPAAQPASGSPFSFKGGITLGSDVLLTGDKDATTGARAAETWTLLGFQPDLAFGKIGLGLDLSFHFILYRDADTAIQLYPGDWVPDYQDNGKSVLDVYLPKILYVRYGLKGEDPLFAKLGSINDLSLGNGFIMSDYSNMNWLPQQRITGLDLGVDGTLFNFPYVGAELLTGNLARFDVVGGRVYARPLVGTSIPILKNMQVGASLVADTNPYLYADTAKTAHSSADTIAAYGADIVVPLLGGKLFPLAAFTDVAVDPNQAAGWMLGFGGKLLGIFTYGGQLRILGAGFIPAYFDSNYDIFRAKKYDYMKDSTNTDGSGYAGWYASIGTSLLADKLVFNAALDGPVSAKGTVDKLDDAKQTDYPHLRGVLRLDQIDQIPFYFDASYDKYLLGAKDGFFQDLIDPTDAVVGLNVNYRTGASVLTLAYNAKWNPTTAQFDVTSSLRASMKF
jgi:hypothetical protein